jgi:AmmeMemoRadiSam system protein A
MSGRNEKIGTYLELTQEDKEQLRIIARAAIEDKARKRSIQSVSVNSERLTEKRGVFVSLYKRGMLRGCAGVVDSSKPLFQTVMEIAESAASEDPRFRRLTEDELPYIDLEISVLSGLQEVTDPEEIDVGVHGIIVEKGLNSGLLLPQVAAERNWDSLTFMRETCRKAGLSEDAWNDGDARIYVFCADVF